MDASGRITALITCVGGVLVAIFDNYTAEQAIGLIVNFANAVNVLFMGSIYCYGIDKCRIHIKNIRGRFTFQDTVLDIAAGPAKKIIPQWHLERECKHRIWHTFWENILLNKYITNAIEKKVHPILKINFYPSLGNSTTQITIVLTQ